MTKKYTSLKSNCLVAGEDRLVQLVLFVKNEVSKFKLKSCLTNNTNFTKLSSPVTKQWTIPLKEAASLLRYFYRDPLRSLTLLSLNVLSQKSSDGFLWL